MIQPVVRCALGGLYLVAGWFHMTAPAPFLAIIPGWVPWPEQVVYWTGLAEVAGALALLQPFGPMLRKAAAWGLAAYALCVWPANFNHFLLDLGKPDHGWGFAYHIPRLAAQPLLIWAALWAGRATDWPFAQPTGSASTE
ncbi:MAG: DoxX family protein [Alteraurantiacibacter sp.]